MKQIDVLETSHSRRAVVLNLRQAGWPTSAIARMRNHSVTWVRLQMELAKRVQNTDAYVERIHGCHGREIVQRLGYMPAHDLSDITLTPGG